MTCDFQQCGILTGVESDEPVQHHFKLRNSKICSVSSFTIVEYSSDKQKLWSDCAYARAGLSPCWSRIPHCWKSYVAAQEVISHTQENHCTGTAQSSRVGCSRRGQKYTIWSTVSHSMRKLFNSINFKDVFFFIRYYHLGTVVHSGSIGAFKSQNKLSTSQFLSRQWKFMCLKFSHTNECAM